MWLGSRDVDRQAVLALCGLHGIAQKAGNGHWANATWYWCDGTGHGKCLGIVHVADEFALAVLADHPVDAHINDDGARFDPIAAHEIWAADSGDDEGRAPRCFSDVLRAGVRDGDGAVFTQQ